MQKERIEEAFASDHHFQVMGFWLIP